MPAETSIVWFRKDLRLADNPAFQFACNSGNRVVPVFVWSPGEESPWEPGGASRWWLHHCLAELASALSKLGLKLILRKGNSLEELQSVITETKSSCVVWNRRYEPYAIKRDARIKKELLQNDIQVKTFNGSLLKEPWEVQTAAGKPYLVYTPFSKNFLRDIKEFPVEPTPSKASVPDTWPSSLPLEALKILPSNPWHEKLGNYWDVGEAAANSVVKQFIEQSIYGYKEKRDFPCIDGTSRISPHLHFGELSPRLVWNRVVKASESNTERVFPYLRQLVWRDFGYHLLYHFPHTTEEPLREKFRDFPWQEDDEMFSRWKKGTTGFPIVDAGMRQLWETGWMHNRLRMVVASFLVKDLLLPWQLGARWFWDTLVDADLANNTLGWQWTAGCGADAAPYFRVFNPYLQSERFDGEGKFVKKWVPEVSELNGKEVHQPPQMDAYPSPIVDHMEAKSVALDAYESLKEVR